MEPIVRTIHGAYLQTVQLLGLPFIVKANSTLNEKFQVHSDVNLGDTDMPRTRYIAIGNGGHTFNTTADGIPTPSSVQHLPRHGSLYNHLPFILRPLSDDLTAIERSKYRMRKIEEINGTRYAAYYLKTIDVSQTLPQLELRDIANGNITSVPFEPTITDLNPVAPALVNNGLVTTTGTYIAATAKVPFTMDEWEVNEFTSACNIKYGDDRYAIISEIALCSGIDRAVSGEFNNVVSGYIDVVVAQVVSFLNVFYSAKFSNTGIDVMFDVGSVEPLLF